MTPNAPFTAPLVDSHAHVYTTDMPLAPTAWHKPPADATIEQYIATLDRHGVEYAVLSAASLFDDYNEYSLEATRKHKRLRTTVIVKPTIDPYVMRMMKDDGAVGVRLQWRHVKSVPDITTAEYQKFFRRVARSRLACPHQSGGGSASPARSRRCKQPE